MEKAGIEVADLRWDVFLNKMARTLQYVCMMAASSIFMMQGANFLQCHCGKRAKQKKGRVIGGTPALDYPPWLGALRRNDSVVCGSSLINDRYVLTALHCFGEIFEKFQDLEEIKKRGFEGWDIVLGEVSRRKISKQPSFIDSANGTTTGRSTRFGYKNNALIRNISDVIIVKSPEVMYNHYKNDIILVQLQTPINFTDRISPICLPPKDLNLSGKHADVVGWGYVEKESKAVQDMLQKATLLVTNREDCIWKFQYTADEIDESSFCASDTYVDTCQGDSGGPLMAKNEHNATVVAGLVSWGHSCDDQNFPGIYVNVSYYVDWIRNSTLDAQYCEI